MPLLSARQVQSLLIWAIITFALGTMVGAFLNDNWALALWSATAALSQATVWTILGTVQTQNRTIEIQRETIDRMSENGRPR